MEVTNLNKIKITSKEFSSKFKSKYEIYQFVTMDVNAYMPHPSGVTIYFLKDIVEAKRKCKKSFISLTSNIDIKSEAI